LLHPGGKAVDLRLVHHGDEGCHVGRNVLNLDRQEELAAGASYLDVVALDEPTALAEHHP
jgi:hypothetical protein